MDIKDFNFDDFDFDTNVDFGIKSVSSDQFLDDFVAAYDRDSEMDTPK